MKLSTALLPLLVGSVIGCGGTSQPEFPPVHPVKGTVKREGRPVSGGSLRFIPEPDIPEFVATGDVGTDGTYSLTTIRTTDKKGEKKDGAPAGTYKVMYMPPGGDQTAGAVMQPTELPKSVTVKAGDNDIPIDLPKR